MAIQKVRFGAPNIQELLGAPKIKEPLGAPNIQELPPKLKTLLKTVHETFSHGKRKRCFWYGVPFILGHPLDITPLYRTPKPLLLFVFFLVVISITYSIYRVGV